MIKIKISKYIAIQFSFIVLWCGYILMNFFQWYIKSLSDFLEFAHPLVPLYLLGVVFSLIYKKCSEKNFLMSKLIHKAYIIIGLILLDQGIKLWVHFFIPMGSKIPLLEKYYYLMPRHNIRNSALLSHFKIDFIPILFMILFKIIAFVYILFMYRYLINSKENYALKFWSDAFIIFALSAQICSLIDTSVWGYSLDYLYIYRVLVLDLKDLYSEIFFPCFLLALSNPSIIEKLSNNKKKKTL